MKKLFFLLALSSILLFFVQTVSADSGDYGQYGQYGQYSGGSTPSQSILINKQVSLPVTQTKGGVTQYNYVDNLTPSDVRFTPGSFIFYKITVKNTSSVALYNVMVTDKVPQYIEPVEGPGTYDPNTRSVSFNAGTFNPNEEKSYTFKMQWNSQDKLPADKGLMCVSNYARAYTDNAADDDTAQACVEKQVMGVKSAPKAGPEMNIVLVAFELGILGIGMKLRRKLV